MNISEFNHVGIFKEEKMLGNLALRETELTSFRRVIKDSYPTATDIIIMLEDFKEKDIYDNQTKE
jgi:hypothetical protein